MRLELLCADRWPATQRREGLAGAFSLVSRSPFSPCQGEKVADRPDEGVFAGSAARESFLALPAASSAVPRIPCKKRRIVQRRAQTPAGGAAGQQ